MVAAHQSFLQSEGYRQYAGTFFAERAGIHMDASSTREYFTPEEHQFTGSNWCQYSADILNISQLFHVSESMVEVCKIAAGQLSEDEVWSQEILPARNGVLVFEIPIELVDVWGRIVTVASVQWYVDKDTVAYSYYTDVHSKNDHYNQILALQGNLEPAARITGTWSLCHVDGIKDGKTLGPYFTEDNPELEE